MAKNKPYRSGGKPNPTGRSERDAQHVRFYHWMLDSPAYRDLRPISRALLIEMARLYNGWNNGEIGLGERQAAKLLGMTDRAAVRRALADLQAHGFIAKTKPSGFSMKVRGPQRATEWRLEWLPMERRGQAPIPATKTFMRWPNLSTERD
jgi:hypothetical protein